jgi:hypothetical protein
MKTVKLTVLFKSGVEKSYIIPEVDDEDVRILYIDLRYIGRSDKVLSLDTILATISYGEIASAELEILQS